jgi:uncharacterized membrane protein YhaH (DUF805 family)
MKWYFKVLKTTQSLKAERDVRNIGRSFSSILLVGFAAVFVSAALGVLASMALSGRGDHVMQTGEVAGILVGILYNLFVVIPSIAVAVRRMHDTGRSGWWLWASVINFIFLCLGSQSSENGYGANPVAAEIPQSVAHRA